MMQNAIPIRIGDIVVYTYSEDIAECLEELDNVLRVGTASGADLGCVLRALDYLKKYKARRPEVIDIVNRVEAILLRDIKEEKVELW